MRYSVISKIIAVSVMMCIFMVPVFSQAAGSEITLGMDDFESAAEIWNRESADGMYNKYIGKIIDMVSCQVPDECYPYLMSELMFYKYYSHDDGNIPVFNGLRQQADEKIEMLRSIEKDYPVIYVAERLFYVVGRYYGNDGVIPLPDTSSYRKIFSLPDAAEERQNLIKAIGSAESMFNRFTNMLSKQGANVSLRFSEDSYIKAMSDPALVYVINNEPTFALLKEALEKTGESLDDLSFGEYADVYYSVISSIGAVKELFMKWGVPLKTVLPEDVSTFLVLSDTDPFALTCLDIDSLLKAERIMNYIVDCGRLYIERINTLSYFTGR